MLLERWRRTDGRCSKANFSLYRKYERGKAVNEALKKNEDLLKKSLSEYEVTVKTVENKYELLKSHATSQLDK